MKKSSMLLAALLMFSLVLASLVPAIPAVRAAYDPMPLEADGWVWVGTAEELAYINQNPAYYLNRNIRLTGSIDMTGYDWVPIGDASAAYSGIFDGRGHRIEGLSINGGTRQYAGLFGYVSGTIRNLDVSAQVSGGQYAGVLAGQLTGGSILDSHSQGTVTSGDAIGNVSVAGGLVGAATGDSVILRSSSSASVKSGEAPNQYAGGLVGSFGAGRIAYSYATGTVTNTGGDHYFFGGGLTGQLIFGTIDISYASTVVVQSENVRYIGLGGFVGILMSGQINASYFDIEASTQTIGIGVGDAVNPPHLMGRTTEQLKFASTYGGWDFADTWAVHARINGGYPYLRPGILTTDLPRAVKGVPYSMAIEAINGARGGLTWNVSGLPDGLALTGDGKIEGSPTVSGAFPVTVSATDIGSNTASATLTLYVDEAARNIDGFVVGPGSENGSTSVTAIPGDAGNTFAYLLGPDEGATPGLGDALPDEAMGYALGTDIFFPAPGHYLQVFELDDQQRILAWNSIRLTASHIRNDISVSGVALDRTELSLTAGGASQKLTAVLTPGDATNQAVSWVSSDSAVAVVDPSGEVTGIAEGTAVVTVTTADGGYTASAAVTVHPAAATGTVTGAVYGTRDAPLAGAAISVGGMDGISNAAGGFALTGVAAGPQRLTVTAAGYINYTVTVDVLIGETVDVGRIVLRAVPAPEPEPSPEPPSYSGSPSAPAPTPAPDQRMIVTVNGQQVRVNIKKEQEPDGRTVLRLMMDSDLVRSWSAGEGDILLDIDNEDPVVKVDFPAKSLKDLMVTRPNDVIRINVNGASFRVPLHVLGGVSNDEDSLTVVIAKWKESASHELEEELTGQGFAVLAEPTCFELYDGDEKIETKGIYLEHTFSMNAETDSDRSTVVWVDDAGKLHFVPSVFKGDTATFYSTHTGAYTVVHSDRTFVDVRGHWAQHEIERMASKLVVNGSSGNAFEPNRTVTRAEFVAMLVRALGIDGKSSSALSYSDVWPKEVWYAGAIGAASAAGLVEGYADGSFRPDAAVTREQVAVILARAIQYAGELPRQDASMLARFVDQDKIADWAKGAAAELLAAGMMEGVGNAAFAPQAFATRAQSAVLLNRMLLYLNFID